MADRTGTRPLLARLFRRTASTEAVEDRAAALPEEVASFRCRRQTDRLRRRVATVKDDPLRNFERFRRSVDLLRNVLNRCEI
jgi:hypothetical protein